MGNITVCRHALCAGLTLMIAFGPARAKRSQEEPGPEMQFETLAGPLPRIVEAAKGPYLVVADLEVPAGRMVTIEAGTVFLFKNFTGLHVQGRLVAQGTTSRPVVFTSEFDRDYNPASTMYPNPYDWNGIYIHGNAIGSTLEHCKLFFSVYGIISETKFIKIVGGVFANNGKTNLVIEGEEHLVADGPYTYELSLKDATVDGVPIKILKDPAAPKRNTFRFAGLGVLLGGAGLGVYSTLQWRDSQDRLEDLSSEDFDNLVNNTSEDWEQAQSDRNRNRILTFAGYGLGVIGAMGVGWSFTF
ncbi:MAG: hypothetical protein GF418_03560 [Chitinivibrionales bacterium]|nr:hypothetical protein [Chitinivibrionales bacterium]MBD3394681.1 hypothetical protein [Chitinivibrionales bacterium]